MELEKLDGSIIGIISNDFQTVDYGAKKVSEIILKKPLEALKMVKLNESILDKNFNDLSQSDKNKVILASKLQDKVIVLIDFSKCLLKKDIDYFKGLFKRIVKYNRKVILIDKNTYLFLNCVTNVYVVDNGSIVYKSDNLYDKNLLRYTDLPKIVEFTNKCEEHGIRIDQYQEIDELLKAIYRIKS